MWSVYHFKTQHYGGKNANNKGKLIDLPGTLWQINQLFVFSILESGYARLDKSHLQKKEKSTYSWGGVDALLQREWEKCSRSNKRGCMFGM